MKALLDYFRQPSCKKVICSLVQDNNAKKNQILRLISQHKEKIVQEMTTRNTPVKGNV